MTTPASLRAAAMPITPPLLLPVPVLLANAGSQPQAATLSCQVTGLSHTHSARRPGVYSLPAVHPSLDACGQHCTLVRAARFVVRFFRVQGCRVRCTPQAAGGRSSTRFCWGWVLPALSPMPLPCLPASPRLAEGGAAAALHLTGCCPPSWLGPSWLPCLSVSVPPASPGLRPGMTGYPPQSAAPCRIPAHRHEVGASMQRPPPPFLLGTKIP